MEFIRSTFGLLHRVFLSMRHLPHLSLLSLSTTLQNSGYHDSNLVQCSDEVSCPSAPSENVNTCCINSPSGHFLLTQFWDSSPPIGARDAWTIHGLWPDRCSGGFDAYCDRDRSRSASQIAHTLQEANTAGSLPFTGLKNFMSEHWLSWDGEDSNLWAHEWNKHGTCVSTLEPDCYPSSFDLRNTSYDILDYFSHAVYLYSTLDTYNVLAEHDIEPSHHRTYTLSDLQDAVAASGHGFPVTFKCHDHDQLNEVWYHFKVRGSLRNASESWSNTLGSKFIPTAPDGQISNCPTEGIRYLPKSISSPGPRPTTSVPVTKTAVPTSTPTSILRPFSGKGHLRVRILSEDNQSIMINSSHSLNGGTSKLSEEVSIKAGKDEYTGCLIRNGAWYGSKSVTSCAVFTAKDDVFQLEDERQSLEQTPLASRYVDQYRQHYHLFTLSSARAPCSFVSSSPFVHQQQPGQHGRLSCERQLSYQTIFNAHINGTEDDHGRSKILAWSNHHQTTLFAENVPEGREQVQLWNMEDDGEGRKREIKVEIHWEAIS